MRTVFFLLIRSELFDRTISVLENHVFELYQRNRRTREIDFREWEAYHARAYNANHIRVND